VSTWPIRVYLAAKFDRREEMLRVYTWLCSLGYVVTSRWLTIEEDQLMSPDGPKWAVNDVEDVLSSDVLVFFAEPTGAVGAGRGGRHVEFGVALATGKEIIVVGKIENIFHRHPRVQVVACKTDMARSLRSFAEARDAENGAAA
jgi:hypothetical protein